MATRGRLLVAVVVGAAVLAACGGGGGGEAKSGTYVGKVSGTDAFIAVVSNGDKVAGYVCDGKQISTWFDTSDVSGGKADLVTRDGDTIGTAAFDGDTASGTVTVGGSDHDFDLDIGTGDAGLYRAAKGEVGQPGSVEVGWVVLNDGSIRGLTAKSGTISPAPMLSPGQTTTVNVSGFGMLAVHQFTDPGTA